MILELDMGNSRTKWRLLSDRLEVCSRGRGDLDEWARAGVPAVWADGVRRIRAASVVGVGIEQKFARQVAAATGVAIEFARPAEMSAGVRNGYEEPKTLGVDRWLALLAAYKMAEGPVLVADIGSALTIDVVDRGGCHRGGYIIPGPRLMQGALLRETDRVRFSEFTSLGGLGFGCDTADCVSAGIAAAQVGAVLVALQQARLVLPESIGIFVTGGWGEALAQHLRACGHPGAAFVPELVLDGLRWALP